MNQRKWILVVEDNVNDAALTLRALSSKASRLEVIMAGDGEEALDCLHRRGRFESRPDGRPLMVLLDIKMPKVDGFEVLRHIKSNPSLQSIPVILFTSSREESDVAQSYRLGANAYLVKPLEFIEYSAMLAEARDFWTVTNEPPPGIESACQEEPSSPGLDSTPPAGG